MPKFNDSRIRRNRLVHLLVIICFISNLFLGAALAQSNPGAADGAGKTIIPKNLSEKIYRQGGRVLNEVCARLSKLPGWDVRVCSEFIDPQNRVFFAVKGKFGHKWPFREIDRDRVLKVETDGDIALDFFINEASTQNGFVTYEFSADIIIKLDGIVISISKFAVGLAASAAIDFAAENLVALLSNIDSKLLSDALSRTCADFSKASFDRSFEALADNLREYERRGPVFRALVNGIRNGNLLSFFVFNVINIGARQSANLAGAALGSVIGTALFPGAGTIIGGLVAKASSLIITKFVVDKIGSEWLLKLELERLVHLAREIGQTQSSGTSLNAKYEKRLANVVSKLREDLATSSCSKFNTLVSFIGSGEKSDVVYLRPVVEELNSFMQAKIISENDWVIARKYLQLKQAAASRGLEKEFGFR